MDELLTNEMKEKTKIFAIRNRAEHGKASYKHVFSKFMSEYKDVIDKTKIKEYLKEIGRICEEVNKMDAKEIEDILPQIEEVDKEKNKKKIESLEDLVNELKDLPDIDKKRRVITRFEPSASGPLHLGHVFPLLLNYWYAKKYNGKMVLRIADTNPQNVLLEAYDMIVDDVEYLTGNLYDPIIQSSRMKYYYEVAEYLIQQGFAYVCLCDSESFKRLVLNKKPCIHREQTPEENLELWKKMLEGEFDEGEAVLRIKTILTHENPAVREWVAFRIIKHPHPLVGEKYLVYPTMNFSVAVDDHSNNITHVIRGKDHETNTLRQQYIFEYMGWDMPVYLHIGRINFEDLKLSTTQIKEKILKGEYKGWDDVRLPFIQSYKKRGFKPEAFSWWVLQIGLTKRDKKTTYKEFLKNLIKIHRVLIDKESDRLFFIKEPIKVRIVNLTQDIKVILPNHPDIKERGYRVLMFSQSHPFVYVEKDDWDRLKVGETIRLKYAFDIRKISHDEGEIVKKNQEEKMTRIIHYLPENSYINCKVIMDNGDIIEGIVESNILEKPIDSRLQFERFGFVKVNRFIKENLYICVETYYIHE